MEILFNVIIIYIISLYANFSEIILISIDFRDHTTDNAGSPWYRMLMKFDILG